MVFVGAVEGLVVQVLQVHAPLQGSVELGHAVVALPLVSEAGGGFGSSGGSHRGGGGGGGEAARVGADNGRLNESRLYEESAGAVRGMRMLVCVVHFGSVPPLYRRAILDYPHTQASLPNMKRVKFQETN